LRGVIFEVLRFAINRVILRPSSEKTRN